MKKYEIIKKETKIEPNSLMSTNNYTIHGRNKNGWQTAFYYHNAVGNCKHCNLHYVGYFINSCHTKDALDRLDEFLKGVCKLTFAVDLIRPEDVEILKERFTLISCVHVPIGYSNKFQYHATFFTNAKYGGSFKENFTGGKQNVSAVLNYPNKNKLEQAKAEYISVGKEVLDKIQSYKSQVWLKKYIEKLIN